ncbi:cytochrome P450 [Lasiosphaeria ovina]|uniref:Cytochrome P450 n=1 Tax=Lasiosphaeria ovina TaxID=92902 RepID=A0AAE0KG51_9PEZI|nr:cytochrome P450 [Lasiosphaeria ovina]
MHQYHPIRDFYRTAVEQYAAMQSAIGPLRLSKTDLLGLVLRKTWHDFTLLLSDLRDGGWRSVPLITPLLGAVLVLVIITTRPKTAPPSPRQLGIPVLKVPKGLHRWDYQRLLQEGARQHPGAPYVITYSGYEYVVFPSSCFDEVKRLPVAAASMVEWYTHVFFQGWRFLGTDKSAVHKTIGLDLTRAVPSLAAARRAHAEAAFAAVLGSLGTGTDWHAFPLYSTAQEVVARTNAASLLGPELAADRRWLNASQRFPMAVMVAVFVCHAVPRLLRPVVSLLAFVPAWGLYWYMRMLLRPTVERDLRAQRGEVEGDTGPDQKPPASKFPVTSWLTARYQGESGGKEQGDGALLMSQMLHDYVVIAFESTASTAATIYFILAELVSRPELVQELRDEITQAADLDGLRKLDSVMRESSRVNIFNYLTLFRRLQQPVQLSLGPTLPRGSLICVDAQHITASAALWGDAPEQFDGLRFFRLRQQPGHEALHQFTSLGSDAPGWGGGAQACPGRVFAANTIKTVLAHLLMHYDIALPPGDGKPKRNSMPNGTMAPDMNARIMLRKRGGGS